MNKHVSSLRVVMALGALAVAACNSSDIVTSPIGAPGGAQKELRDATKRVNQSQVNAWVYGTFAIQVGSEYEVITEGPANFPGKPKDGPGTCVNGKWFNSQGKGTSGSLDKPHPHCVREGNAITIVLEPISSRYSQPGTGHELYSIDLAQGEGDGSAAYIRQLHPQSSECQTCETEGKGTVIAYAIDASTINDIGGPTRVGTLTINMNSFDDDLDLFLAECNIAENVKCLNKVITAQYDPLDAPNGVGTSQTVNGFLYWTPATAPYNY